MTGKFVMLSVFRVGFFKRGDTRADSKCEWKELPVSNKLTIDFFGVIRMSVKY